MMTITNELPVEEYPEISIQRRSMNGKPVFEIDVKSVINFKSAFSEKELCDGFTFSLGSACAYNCAFCYVESVVRRHPQVVALLRRGIRFQDIVIRRRNALDILREQLTVERPGHVGLIKPAVIFTSPLVDPAANLELARETLEACLIILRLTNWTVRILSKSHLLPMIAKGLPAEFRDRAIFGVSTGTLDDRLARSFEQGTALVSKRIESLHWLQDHGFRTFGMICPSLPQENYDQFAQSMAAAIRVDRCEHVWAEAINVRGDSLQATLKALVQGGFDREAAQLREVSGPGASEAWENYARNTFLAHCQVIAAEKLRFLQYVTPQTRPWWENLRTNGALLLGKGATE